MERRTLLACGLTALSGCSLPTTRQQHSGSTERTTEPSTTATNSVDTAGERWPQQLADCQRTGIAPSLGQLNEQWQTTTSGAITDPVAQPVVSDEKVICGHSESIHSLDAQTGERLWTTQSETGEGFDGRPSIAGDEVYTTARDELVALSTTDGSRRRVARTPPGTRAVTDPLPTGKYVATGVRGPDTEALLLVPDAGEQSKVVEIGGPPRWLAGTTEVVYARTDTSLVAVSFPAGETVWRVSGFNRDAAAGPPLVDSGTVVTGGSTGDVVAVNRTEGTIRWRQQIEAGGVFSPVSVRDRFYVTDTSRTLYALKRSSGDVVNRWKLRSSADRPGVAAGSHDGSPVVAGETVVAVTPEGGVVGIEYDAPDVAPRQFVDVGERVAAPPAIVNEALFVTAPPSVYRFGQR